MTSKIAKKQVITNITGACIPFIEHDDILRVQMACSQMRQAIILNDPEPPLVYTGFEDAYLHYTTFCFHAPFSGKIIWKDDKIIVLANKAMKMTFSISIEPKSVDEFDTTIEPHVELNDDVKEGQLIASARCINKEGRLCLGRNLLTAVFTYEGWNFEDALVVTEKAAEKMSYTRTAIEKQYLTTSQILDIPIIPYTKNADEKDVIFHVIDTKPRNIDQVFTPQQEFIMPFKGSVNVTCRFQNVPEINNVWINDVVRPYVVNVLKQRLALLEKLKSYFEINSTEQLFDEIIKFDHDLINYLVESFDNNIYGEVKVIMRQNVPLVLGSKLANRHGNKGVISLITNGIKVHDTDEDIDIVINPLGIISRMNLGQLYELHLTRSMKNLVKKLLKLRKEDGKELLLKFAELIHPDYYEHIKHLCETCYDDVLNELQTYQYIRIYQPPFESIDNERLQKIMALTETPFTEKIVLHNGKTVEAAVGYVYWYRLVHEPYKKIFSRSVGTYNRFNQPVKGKEGGHRVGEMEVWALFAHNALETIKELLKYRSDNPEKHKLLEHLFSGTIDFYQPSENIETTTYTILKTLLQGCGIKLEL